METGVLKEVLECLSDERRLVHYYKDRYAVYYLERLFLQDDEVPVAALKTARWERIRQKRVVKDLLARCGGGVIRRDVIEHYFPQEFESFVLTLSEWGDAEDYRWDQTSRPGCNLVLQLNFTNEHDQFLSQHNIDKELFRYVWHPVHEQRCSLAWARIDIDFATGEALIEEVQNDWLRRVLSHNRWAKRTLACGRTEYRVGDVLHRASAIHDYTQMVIKRYAKLWSETMLYCTVKFIREELGFSKIFYHSVDTGKCLKNINTMFPPVSIYSELPRKLCFDTVESGPDFIMKCNKIKRKVNKIRNKEWFYLEL